MSKSKAESVITQSLLDRLSDQEDWPTRRDAAMRMLRESVKRDVEWLLNTRRPLIPEIEEYEKAAASVINYGLPDLMSFEGAFGRDHNALLAAMVKVLTDLLGRSLRFHVEGRIQFESIEEEIQFDTVLELLNGEYEVK